MSAAATIRFTRPRSCGASAEGRSSRGRSGESDRGDLEAPVWSADDPLETHPKRSTKPMTGEATERRREKRSPGQPRLTRLASRRALAFVRGKAPSRHASDHVI